MLHEVRNPVNAILNGARVLDAGATGDRAARMIEVIVEAAGRIQGITEALDQHVRPADGGAAQARPRQGLASTLRLLEHRLDGVTVHWEGDADPVVDAPAGPVNQVLMNLLDNALALGARTLWLGIAVDADRVRITVDDDGPGVPPSKRDRIFDPFVSGRGSSGLGLYVSRRIVEEHHGSLTCEARPGGGARFVVELHAAT